MVSEWVAKELESVDLGDERLNARLRVVLSMLAATPSKSIPASANGGHNETTAAYRLFDNSKLGFENILEPHIASTFERLRQEKVVIVAQDTTELDLTRPNLQVEGAGPLDGNARFGELLHPLVAFTPNGTPLGTLRAELWTRESGSSKAKNRQELPIEENNAPDGEDAPVDWMLLTNMPVSTKEEIELVLAYYCVRWMMEIFFRTLKSGTQIESRRFETLERFERCLAVLLIVAWRTLYTTRIGREFPDVSCESVFNEAEWQPVYKLVTKQDPPTKPPTLREMIRLIARLGGYIDRARDDEPGPETTMRGMERLHDISNCWITFGPKAQHLRL